MQHLLQGLTTPDEGGYRGREKNAVLPKRCDRRWNQVRRATELLGERTKSFQDFVAQNSASRDRSRRRRGSANTRIALPRSSRAGKLLTSAYSKYGAKYLDRQRVFWSILDSRKSPVKGYESGMGGHGQESFYLKKSVHVWLFAQAAFRSTMPMRIFSRGWQCALAGNSGLCSCSP